MNRVLNKWDAIAINLAIIIGVGIFRVPSEVAKYLPSLYFILLAWLIGGIFCFFGALCFSELATSFPKTGGSYIYLRKSYGTLVGFLFGWTELLVIRTGSIAAVSYICAEYIHELFSLPDSFVKILAVSIVLLFSGANLFGLDRGKKTQDIFTIAKIAALVIIVLLGVSHGGRSVSHAQSLSMSLDKNIISLFGLALIPILWTYGGWHENIFVAEETKDTTTTIPFALMTGVVVTTALYLAVNALYFRFMTVHEIAQANVIGSDILQAIFGKIGIKVFNVVVIVSSLGAINAMIITGSRITFAMAKDNAFFQYIGETDARYGVPRRALTINAIWAAALILWGTFNTLLFFTGILVWLFFALTVSAIFILRRKYPNIHRPYKVWFYPVTPLIFMFVCLFLSINTLICYPFQSFVGLCIVLSGIPVFMVSRKRIHHSSPQ